MFLWEMTPTERAARATLLLVHGEGVTVRRLATELEITPRGARSMLERLSRVMPLVDEGGQWRWCGSDGRFGEESPE